MAAPGRSWRGLIDAPADYRKDIDGLRAIAVIAVLLYHAEFRPFSGGFLGVDIFFVISGYLITGLILRDAAGARFTLGGFYDRRIRRIIPALAAMLAFSALAAFLMLLPDELVDFGKNLAAAALFSANFLDWHTSLQYFAPHARGNPLLHVWSLAVEEQFYLLWPLLLLPLSRSRWLKAAIALLLAASLAAAAWTSRSDPVAGFYMLPTRAWELLAGAALAAGWIPPLRRAIWRIAASIAGVFFMAAGLCGLVPAAAYPGLGAIAVVAGAVLVLHAGSQAVNPVGAALGSAVPSVIGRISYSLYLYHWPLLVFGRIYLGRDLQPSERALALAICAAAALLSWRFIEQPFRRHTNTRRAIPRSFPAAAGASAALLLVAAVMILGKGLPARLPQTSYRMMLEARTSDFSQRCVAPRYAEPILSGNACVLGAGTEAPSVLVWGDSHAARIAPALAPVLSAAHKRLRLVAIGGCPPLPRARLFTANDAPYPKCPQFGQTILRYLAQHPEIRIVVLAGFWTDYLGDTNLGDHIVRFADARGLHLSHQAARTDFSDLLNEIVHELQTRGLRVLIAGPVPAHDVAPVRCAARQALTGHNGTCGLLTAGQAQAQLSFASQAIADVVRRNPGSRVFWPATALCDAAGCHGFQGDRPLYSDEDHLSDQGASLLVPALKAALQSWLDPFERSNRQASP
ncbi:MAG TPA: acyltransferase family protein [Rhizomicrobium sp.]|nr:acyltransferase family protein [Rhizomicrobium sp.]